MTEKRHFLFEPDSIDADEAVQRGEEFHHLERVVRARRGEEGYLMDGAGGVYKAAVRDIRKSEAILDILSRAIHEPPRPIDIAVSAIRAPRLDLVAEKCGEIGCRRLIVFHSDRSVSKPGKGRDGGKSARLRRKALSACKQSGQPFFPEIVQIDGVAELGREFGSYGRVFLAERDGMALDESIRGGIEGALLGIIGPEGGFTDEERAMMVSGGASLVALGTHRLRSETAAICMLFALRGTGD